MRGCRACVCGSSCVCAYLGTWVCCELSTQILLNNNCLRGHKNRHQCFMFLKGTGGGRGIPLNCSQARLITRSPLSPLQPRSAYFAYYKLATHPAGHQLRLLCLPVPSWTIRLCPFRGTVLCNLWPSAATCDCACVRVCVRVWSPCSWQRFCILIMATAC